MLLSNSVSSEEKKLWHKCKKMATLQVRCWYRRRVELLRRRWRDVWREDRSVNETDETRQREKRRVNRLILAAWSPGLGSALAGRESLRLALQSTRGRIERSPTFDPIRTQAWTLPPPQQHLGQEEVRYEKYEGVKGQIQCDFSLSGLYFDCFCSQLINF